MQTFVPYADFGRSAEVLDDKRLGKQRVEALQIMQVLLRLRWNNAVGEIEDFQPRGWTSHPAVLMWKGYERALLEYQRQVCDVWTSRGFKDTCYPKTLGLVLRWNSGTPPEYVDPPWRGDERIHRSHQSNLIRKDADLYGPLFSGVPGDEQYLWPVSKESDIDVAAPGYSSAMTDAPIEPGEADSNSPDDDDQDSEPTSTAPEENNPTVPNPPD